MISYGWEPIPSSRDVLLNKELYENPNDIKNLLERSILTPTFYTDLVHYQQVAEALSEELLCAHEEDRTISASEPELLTMIFRSTKDETLPLKQIIELRQQTCLDHWKRSALWALHRALEFWSRRPDKGQCMHRTWYHEGT